MQNASFHLILPNTFSYSKEELKRSKCSAFIVNLDVVRHQNLDVVENAKHLSTALIHRYLRIIS